MKIFLISEVGVTTIKNTNPSTMGDIILPNVKPNNIQSFVIGLRIDGLKKDIINKEGIESNNQICNLFV